MTPVRLPLLLRNPVSLAGIAVATAMATLFLVLALLDSLGYITNPYFGLVLFVALPLGFLAGLALIPLGVWLARRRPSVAEWPVVDLRVPRQRATLAGLLALTLLNVVVLSMAAYGGVHYMETAEFCGTTCHVTMEPQWAAYEVAPHANAPCVACHVGPGAGALVESKLAGTRQLFRVVTGTVPRPVPSPRAMRPAPETCEGCHWPEKFHGDVIKTLREYADDEPSTESATTLVLRVGGGSARLGIGAGIHWHMNIDNRIDFLASGAQDRAISYVRLTDRSGAVTEYFAEGVGPEQVAGAALKRMDCMDCHNRPAHTFAPTPERAVDARIAQGLIPRELPYVRREALAAVRGEYAGREEALAAIARRLEDFYRSRPAPPDPRLLARAVAGAQDAWARNVFPEMRVTWGTYTSHLGHVESPGCFRCHDEGLKTADGRSIGQDCELCHEMK